MYYTPVFALLLSMSSHANEVVPVRITNVEGSLTFAYRDDAQKINLAGDTSTEENRTAFEQALQIDTKGYVYHPKFLSFELGVGPQMVQSETHSITGSTYQSEELYNVNALMDFLQDKPYPLKLSYFREHPTVSVSLEDQFEQENVHYGVNFQLKKPLLPINLVIDHSRNEMHGEGFEKRVDENTEQTIVRTYFPSGLNGHQQLILTSTEVHSNTRFLSEPESPVTYTTNNISYDSNLYFGKNDRTRMTNIFALTEQTGVRDYRELRLSPSLRLRHSKDTESVYKLNYVNNDQLTIQSSNQYASAGVHHSLTENIDINGEASRNHDETTGLANINDSAGASIKYTHDFNNGKLTINSGIRMDHIDRSVTSDVPVDTTYTLTPMEAYELPHDHIDHASITASFVKGGLLTIRLGTACSEAVELLVTARATRTHVTYCNGGADPTPENIQVSYEYDPGGTVIYNNQISFMQMFFEWQKQHSIYANIRSNKPNIEQGDPILPLDDSVTFSSGARSNFPLGNDREIGAEYTSELHQSSLTPYERNVFDIYYQNPLWKGNLRLSAQKLNTDYLTSSEDLDATRYTIQYRARPYHTMSLLVNYIDNTDIGGSVARHTQTASISLNLNIRKFSFGSELRSYDEFLGDNKHHRSLLRLYVQRKF